jgi:hypothetical protein
MYILVALSVITVQSCVKDPLADITAGGWNHQRTVETIKFENQVGQAVIENTDATTGIITVTLNVAAVTDMSKVKIKKLFLAYQATASVKTGDYLNFSNATQSAVLTVTSTTGEKRDYTIVVKSFIETVLGTWKINQLSLFGGTGPEWGGGGVLNLSDKPWCWSTTYGPSVECDNALTFTLDSISDAGNTYGTVVNDAGADGKYADFIYVGSNPDNAGASVDLTGFYRQIPKGKSNWVRNYAQGTLSFIDGTGKVTTGTFAGAGKETFAFDNGYSYSLTVPNNAFEFTLSGTDDWNHIYSDYDKFVKKPRKFWVLVTKQ